MFDFIAGLLGGLLGGSVGKRHETKQAVKRMEEFRQGKDVRVPCALRYEGESAWRHGDLILSAGNAKWAPPAMNVRTVDLIPAEIIIDGCRDVSIKESWHINAGSSVLSCRLGEKRFELAIPKEDLGPVKATFDLPI